MKLERSISTDIDAIIVRKKPDHQCGDYWLGNPFGNNCAFHFLIWSPQDIVTPIYKIIHN